MVISGRNEAKYLEKVKNVKNVLSICQIFVASTFITRTCETSPGGQGGVGRICIFELPPTYNFSELSIELTQGHARKVVTLLVAKNRRKRKFGGGGASESVVGRRGRGPGT